MNNGPTPNRQHMRQLGVALFFAYFDRRNNDEDYKQLQSQAEAEDQQKIRMDAASAASARLQQVYGKHYNAQLARESQQDVAAWLGESTQPASIREFLHRAEKKTHSTPNHHKDTPER